MAITYDYIIIGAGASGCHLALAMLEDSHFKDCRVLIIEKSAKSNNDKTWSFWENEKGKWDDITTKQWNYANVYGHGEEINIDLKTMRYKMLRSVHFYKTAKDKIKNEDTFTYVEEEVIDITEDGQKALVKTSDEVYEARHVFDSRLPEMKKIKESNATTILQHFKGYFIKTKEKVFDPQRFTMMDYRLKDGDSTSFTYVLPIDEYTGLVEFTYFTPQIVSDERYESLIDEYLKKYMGNPEYKIEEVEKGVIPMSTYNFSRDHTERVTQIGTSGGWVKASSGYSFKFSERKAAKIVQNINLNKPITSGLDPSKYKRYDRIFIDVLYNHNHYGETIFYRLYKKNDTRLLLNFLDEQTTFKQDLRIINSLRSDYFIKAFFKTLFD